MAKSDAQQSLAWDDAEATLGRLSLWPPALQGLNEEWVRLIAHFFASDAGHGLSAKLTESLAVGAVIYPPEPFRALALTPLKEVRVVILGQDPYHGPGQAEGLAFSVAPGVRVPPSLRNIFKELQQSLGIPMASHGSLVRWAQQGVLLLNTSLTVEAGRPGGHARWGWECLTDALVSAVAQSARPVVFLLWGAHAQAKKALIDAVPGAQKHLVLQANHPSPLSAMRPPLPFLGCGHFKKTNDFFIQAGEKPIDW